MKNRIFSIILSIVLSLPIAVWAVDDIEQNEALLKENAVEEVVETKMVVSTFQQLREYEFLLIWYIIVEIIVWIYLFKSLWKKRMNW